MTVYIKIFDDYGMSQCDAAYQQDEIFSMGMNMEGNEIMAVVEILKSLVRFQDAVLWPCTSGDEVYE